MTRKESRTTITISRKHYIALQKLGGKTDTFDMILGKLLKGTKILVNSECYGLRKIGDRKE